MLEFVCQYNFFGLLKSIVNLQLIQFIKKNPKNLLCYVWCVVKKLNKNSLFSKEYKSITIHNYLNIPLNHIYR